VKSKASISALLCLCVAVCLSVPAFAANELGRAWQLLERGSREEARQLAAIAFSRAENRREKGEAFLIQALAMPDGERATSELKRFLTDYKGHTLEWRAEFELGLHSYALGAYVRAGQHFRRATELGAPAPAEARARYWLGLALVGSRNFTDARKHLELVKAADGGSGLASAASLSVADCLREEGQYSLALAEYLRVGARLARSDWLSSALYGTGFCYEKLKRESEAREVYSRLAREFPSSSEAAVVREKLRLAPQSQAQGPETHSYTVQVGAFSQQTNASKLVAALEGKGVTDVRVTREERGGRVLFIVHLGDFPTKEAAERSGRELSTRFGLSYSVVAR
jgi:TolA-binding protein